MKSIQKLYGRIHLINGRLCISLFKKQSPLESWRTERVLCELQPMTLKAQNLGGDTPFQLFTSHCRMNWVETGTDFAKLLLLLKTAPEVVLIENNERKTPYEVYLDKHATAAAHVKRAMLRAAPQIDF